MVEPQTATVSKRIALAWPWQRVALVSLVVLTLLLACINLPYAPRTWFDEGSHLHVPKTLVQYGVYADISSEGYRYHGPTIGVGPTVMLPIAAVFQRFGIGLLQGRLVIVTYLLVALTAGYALARRLHGTTVALLALLLLLASRTLNFEGFVEYGRQVLGEVPGSAFLFLGALAWTWAVAEPRAWWRAAVTGLLFGLALVTKNQFVLIVPPALGLAAFLDWRYYKTGGWALRLLPVAIACGCFGLWTLMQLQFLGPDSFAANLAQTRRAAGGAIFVFDLAASVRALRYLAQPFGMLLIPALAVGLWRCRLRTPTAFAELPAVLIPTLWLGWYLISLGWPRYALPVVAFGALATARLLADLVGWLRARRWPALAWGVGLYAVVVIALPLALTARGVMQPDDSAQRMATYLNANVPTATIIETWEPELGLLTDHRYHYPPIELLDTAVRDTWLAGPALVYDGLAQQPAYVVVGAFGAWVGIYPPATLAQSYRIAYQVGTYTLYARAVAP